jgi:hypothetical protein
MRKQIKVRPDYFDFLTSFEWKILIFYDANIKLRLSPLIQNHFRTYLMCENEVKKSEILFTFIRNETTFYHLFS